MEVAQLWREHPGANIGVRPGGGTIILDTDSAAAARFVDELGLPETPQFAHPEAASTST